MSHKRRKDSFATEKERRIASRRARLMHSAINHDHVGMMKAMLNKGGMNLEASNSISSKLTLLHAAIRSHHVDVALRLISLGADVRAMTRMGRTPLQFAVMNNSHVDLVKEMLPTGRYINDYFEGTRSLDYAIEGRNERKIEKLASQGANRGVDHALVQKLLDSGARVNTRDHNGCSPLQCAVYTGDVKLVKTLLNAGAHVNNPNDIGTTPLHDAVLCCNEEMVLLLLSRGAYIASYRTVTGRYYPESSPGDIGQTALHWAAMLNVDNSHTSIIKLLLLFRGDLNEPESTHASIMTAFSYVLMYGDVDLVNYCIDEYNADLKQSIIESSALAFAAQNENEGVMDLVLRSGIEINLKDKLERTPLHYASQVSMLENVRKLIARGADVNAKASRYGWTPLYLCMLAPRIGLLINKNYVNRRSINRPNYAEERRRTIRLLLESGSDVCYTWMTASRPANGLMTTIPLDVETRKFIVEHMVKVEAKTGKPLFDDHQMTALKGNPNIDGYYRKCQSELATMRTTRIEGTLITYFSVLTEPLDVVARYARNEEFVKELETGRDYRTDFPIYAEWLRDKFDAAIARLEVMERVCAVLSATLRFADPTHVAFEIVFKHLSEADIDLLIN